jgi:L-lactate dehydrogenase complex protein LldG
MPSEASFASWWRADRGAGSAPVSSPDEAQPRISTHQSIEPHALGIRPRHRSLPSTGKDTRERILASVSFANATRQEPAAVPRTYRRPARAETLSTLELFTQRVNDYQARVTHTTDANVAASIAEALRSRGSSSVVIPGGLPTNWLSEHSGGVIIDDGATDVETLDATDAVVTGCAAAIAETGTVILNSLPDQGRRIISLIPDHHVVIVRQSQIVSDVPEVISKLDTSLAQTWISGPSATSDIELSRVEGVHGPRKLDVIVLTGL